MTPAPSTRLGTLRAYAEPVALVAAATALSWVAHPWLALPDTAMVYVLVIVAAAVRSGRGASVLAAALSVATYDFFFVSPRYTLVVDDPRHLVTFVAMFVVGQVISTLTLRLRRSEAEAHAREARTVRLVTERARLEAEARAAANEAEAEKLRSTLLSAVSHDLRTPLAAITGAATTLRADPESLDGVQRDELLATICEEAERMERLIGNLLDMTRLESGAVRVRREWVPLEEVVGSALTRLDARLAGREVKATLPAELPLVSVDPVLLEQLFFNLIENGTRHTPAGSPLEVVARARPDGDVEVEVADRGPGLPPGAESRVFERFFHAGSGGVGLGLAIAQSIAVAHGGALEASPREGGGTVFRLRLPSSGPEPTVPSEGEEA